MEIWIYGAGKRCDDLIKKLSQYPEITVKGIADSFVRGIKYGFKILDLLHNDITDNPKEDIIVITMASVKNALEITKTLREKGYLNIYYYLGKTKSFQGFFKGECKKIPDSLIDVFPSIEMHTNDYCNLNCAGCVHFSPLFPKNAPIFENRIKDLITMKKLCSDIVIISLLGGEPLLNNEICRYMQKSREIFPDAEIQLITNGLLIPKMNTDFFKIAKDFYITIVVSVYFPTLNMLDNIIHHLEKYNIEYILRDASEKSRFNRPLSLKNDSVFEKHCISKGCTAVCEGKIARCPTLLYINRFNEFFKKNLPSEGIYSLSEFNNGDELQRKMKERVPLCDYCVLYDMPWHICGNEISIEDFASFE